MDVRNCKMCGRLFNVLNNERICPACQKKLEDKFHEVKEYLEEHPGASVEQTATDNDISTKQIRQWVREERLILSTATEAGIVCETDPHGTFLRKMQGKNGKRISECLSETGT